MPTPLEVASGVVVGAADGPPFGSPPAATPGRPLAALEAAISPYLADRRCLVSFSGGVDSSLVLAVAVRAARRHGLDMPVPVTLRFPLAAARAQESEWQELVIRHLRLSDWETIAVRDELDYLGPFSRRLLEAHGVVYPANAYVHLPVFRHARDATVLTGWGGDDVFHSWPWMSAAAVLRGRRRPQPFDVLRVGRLLSPERVRRSIQLRRVEAVLPAWLRPEARRRVIAAWSADARTEPRRYDRWLPWLLRQRYVALTAKGLGLAASLEGARVAHPLLDPGFVAALGRRAGPLGWENRAEAVGAFASSLLPPEVVTRKGGAWFGEAFWGPYTLAFTQRWGGGGVDSELVDEGVLRAVWRRPVPDYRSVLLLQQAWLELEGRSTPAR